MTDPTSVYERLEVERDGPVLRVWMNRPDQRNAQDQTMIREVGDCFLAAATDFDARVIVLGGRGSELFGRGGPAGTAGAGIVCPRGALPEPAGPSSDQGH